MTRQSLSIVDTHALASLASRKGSSPSEPTAGGWVRIVRGYLRMTQAELARRAKITQPHLAAIERDKVDPQIGTLTRIFAALQCKVSIRPMPEVPLDQQLRARAQRIALKQIEHSFGAIKLNKMGAEARVFQRLLDKRTEDVMNDRKVRLVRDTDTPDQ